jgi:phosphoglycolate phosphatase
MKRAIVFDLDGTLLNSLPDLADACNLALQESGYPVHNLDDYRWMVGDGALELARRSLPQDLFHQEEIVNNMLQKQTENYRNGWHRKSQPYPNIGVHLHRLHQFPLALYVFSNKNEDFVHNIVDFFFPGVSFSGIIGYSKKYPRKPNPEALLMHFSHDGVLPQDALMIGDSAVDVQTAIQAGMDFIGAGASQVCSNVDQLFKMIHNWINHKEVK